MKVIGREIATSFTVFFEMHGVCEKIKYKILKMSHWGVDFKN
jgi:hypothetical protein